MPALGGAPVPLIDDSGKDLFYHSAPEWSSDSTRLAAVSYQESGNARVTVAIVSVVTREVQRLNLPGVEESRLDLSWSRDGRYLAYVDAAQQQSEVTQLRVVRMSDGSSTALTNGRTNVRRPRWSLDGRYLFYVANREGPPDLWRQSVADDGSTSGESGESHGGARRTRRSLVVGRYSTPLLEGTLGLERLARADSRGPTGHLGRRRADDIRPGLR